MAEYFYLTAAEKARLAKAREANPDLPMTRTERMILLQSQDEARAKVKAEAEQRKADRAAAIPDHEKRPVNTWRMLYEMHRDQPDLNHPVGKEQLAKLKREADKEDAKIDTEMKEKKRLYLLATDKRVQNAVKVAEGSLALAPAEDKAERARVLAIAEEGDFQQAWKLTAELDERTHEREKAKTVDLATQRSAADAVFQEQKRKADEATARFAESVAEAKKALATPPDLNLES